MNYEAMGQRIRTFRKLRRLSQEQLAELADISAVYMSHIETANAKPSLPVIVRIAYALKVSIDEIVYDVPPFGSDRVSDNVDVFLKSSTPDERDILIKTMGALKDILDEHFK